MYVITIRGGEKVKLKPIKFKKLHQLIAVMLISTSLMGVGYAYWTEGITVTGTVQTTKIESNSNIVTEYQFCAHEHSRSHSCGNIDPKIKITNNGKLPIIIDSVEIVGLEYYGAKYEDAQYISSWYNHRYWSLWTLSYHDDWKPNYTQYIRKSNLSGAKTIHFNQVIKTFNNVTQPQVEIAGSRELTLGMSYNGIVDQINSDMKNKDIYTNKQGYTHRINNIDVDKEGILKVKVNYRQWNTVKGWHKTISMDIPTNWDRFDVDGHTRIYPNNVDYAYTNIPDVNR